MRRPIQTPGLSEQGGALLLTLVCITIITLLAGMAAAFYVARQRLMQRDRDRLQAQYAAEAALYVTLDSLHQNPFWLAARHPVPLDDGLAYAAIEAVGGFHRVQATAIRNGQVGTVEVYAGAQPTLPFKQAIYLLDTTPGLHLAGTTRIQGDVSAGPRGVTYHAFGGKPFTGYVDGQVHRGGRPEVPTYDTRFVDLTLQRLQRLLHGERLRKTTDWLGQGAGTHWVEGDLHISARDSLWQAPFGQLVATGYLTVEGPVHLPDGLWLVAGKTLALHGAVEGRDGLYYGRQGVQVGSGVQASAQVLSEGIVTVSGDAWLMFPSMVYVGGTSGRERILVQDDAVVEGMVMYPERQEPVTDLHGRIVVEGGAMVRGGIFNAHETTFHGHLEGSLVTHQLYFYTAPTRYVNWMLNAQVGVGARPAGWVIPIGFSSSRRLTVYRWLVSSTGDMKRRDRGEAHE